MVREWWSLDSSRELLLWLKEGDTITPDILDAIKHLSEASGSSSAQSLEKSQAWLDILAQERNSTKIESEEQVKNLIWELNDGAPSWTETANIWWYLHISFAANKKYFEKDGLVSWEDLTWLLFLFDQDFATTLTDIDHAKDYYDFLQDPDALYKVDYWFRKDENDTKFKIEKVWSEPSEFVIIDNTDWQIIPS